MPKTLAQDATLATVWPHLTHQRDYIAGLFNKMKICVKQHGNADVRLGVTGTGQKPCYRISYRTAEGSQIFGSFWDNHQPLDNEVAKSENWSKTTMSFEQVEVLFRDKVGWKGNSPKS